MGSLTTKGATKCHQPIKASLINCLPIYGKTDTGFTFLGQETHLSFNSIFSIASR